MLVSQLHCSLVCTELSLEWMVEIPGRRLIVPERGEATLAWTVRFL
jgi:hypothetical protein